MPRFNVEYQGKWAAFSTVVDAFVSPFMELEDYEKWKQFEGDIRYQMSFDEALFCLCLNKKIKEVKECLEEIDFEVTPEIDEMLKKIY